MGDDLDALTSQLSGGFQVDPAALGEHPRFSQYKNLANAVEQQAKRRQEALDRQKEGRFQKMMKLRNLGTEDFASDEEDTEQSWAEAAGGWNWKKRSKYADQLMLSEWLVDIPQTLSTDWTMVLAPQGKRCLVVATRGSTTSYNKAGRQLSQFQSKLPGGSARAKGQLFTILDCIYSNHVFHVLDLISWGGHEYAENPYDFRQFMLKSKLDENPELATPTAGFRNVFVALPTCPCSDNEMEKLIGSQLNFLLDGVLFYHNSVIYESGQSALVGWLKPWMLPEVLSISIPPKFQHGTPTQTSAQFIETYNQKYHHSSKIEKSMEQD